MPYQIMPAYQSILYGLNYPNLLHLGYSLGLVSPAATPTSAGEMTFVQ